jgi:L-rhamnose mutarotase
MQRIATYMSLKPGLEERYRTEHEHIWPEVRHGIRHFGLRNYTIFSHGRDLYSYFEVDDLDQAMRLAAADPVNQRWQAHMAGFFEVSPGVSDGSTVLLEEVFHTEGDQQSTTPRQRVAALMRLKEGLAGNYKTAHQQIWPEILAGMARAGISNYSIFRLGRTLFSYFEVNDLDQAMAMLAADPDNRRWQKQMAPMFDIGPGRPAGSTLYLEEVFYNH